MGQQDILDFLKNNPDEWFTINKISEEVKICQSNVRRSLLKLTMFVIRRYISSKINEHKIIEYRYKNE